MKNTRSIASTTAAIVGGVLLTATAAFAGTGEFGGQCAMGHVLGKAVDTKCEITWTSEAGKTYCFGNEDAKKAFLENSEENVAKAAAHYAGTQAQ